MIVDENNFDIIDRASKMTGTDYGIRWFDVENINGYIETESLLSMVDDLIYEIDLLNEKIEDREQDIQDNYRRISVAEQVGISDRDFI